MYREPGCMRQGGRDLVPDVNYIGGQNYILCRPVKCPPSLPTRNAPTKFYFQRPPRASKSIINEELNLTRFWNRIPFRCDIIIYTSDVSLGNFTFASRVKRFPLYDTFRFVPFSLLSLIFSHREDEFSRASRSRKNNSRLLFSRDNFTFRKWKNFYTITPIIFLPSRNRVIYSVRGYVPRARTNVLTNIFRE